MKPLLVLSGLILATACTISPKAYESAPVTVQTSKGAVVCQLYTKEIVEWDRAIQRPQSMSIEEADNICLEAGRRWQQS